MRDQAARSVQHLMDLGLCQPSVVGRANVEAKKFSPPGFAMRIPKAEKLLGAAGDSTRIKILLPFSEREVCACEGESALGLAQPSVSHHLGALEQVGFVERDRKERWAFSRVSGSPTVSPLKDLTSQ